MFKEIIKKILLPVVPSRVLAERRVFQLLGRKAGKIYITLRCLDECGIRRVNRRRAPAGAKSFVFVCHGNIMRSPMAELMFRQAMSKRGQTDIVVRSAGIHAIVGTAAHPYAQVVAQELGLSLVSHRSQLLIREMVAEADAVFAMDFRNKAELLALFPEAMHKIILLSAYAEGAERYREIRDPFFGDQEEARRCYRTIQTCVDNLAASLTLEAAENSRILIGRAAR